MTGLPLLFMKAIYSTALVLFHSLAMVSNIPLAQIAVMGSLGHALAVLF
jgi:hypothetical protein